MLAPELQTDVIRGVHVPDGALGEDPVLGRLAEPRQPGDVEDRTRRFFNEPVGPDPARVDAAPRGSCLWSAAARPLRSGPVSRSGRRRGGRPELLFGRGGAGAAVVIPVRQVTASEHALERPPECAQDLERAPRRVVGVDLEAQ